MKSIKSRYSVKNINPKYFGSVDVASGTTGDISIGTTTEKGLIFMPYVMKSAGVNINGVFYPNVETQEEKSERIREERNKKLERIFKSL